MTAADDSVVYENVSKSFGRTTVLHGLDLRLGAGELVSVLGPSGCGKTTALRILAGFEKPTSGRVYVHGRDVTALPTNRRDVGMVFQAYSLFPNLTVQDNVEYGLRVRKVRSDKRRRQASDLLEMCGLAELGDRYPHQLSGGQQQRVALARALAIQPGVLLLDEPLSALDAIVRTQIREEIRRLQQQLGITTLFVTHDQEEALSIADRVAVMNRGVIEQFDQPQNVYQNPSSEFVARFVGNVTELGVDPDFSHGTLDVHAPGRHLDTLFVRPEHLVLRPHEAGTCRVVSQVYMGERTLVRATDQRNNVTVLSSVTASDASALTPGTTVSAELAEEPALRVRAGESAERNAKI